MSTQKLTCPTHHIELTPAKRQFGWLWICSVPECDITCSGKRNCTPAGKATREARRTCHRVLHQFWKREKAGRQRALRKQLAKSLGISERQCYVGMFSIEQCAAAIVWAKAKRK